MKVSNRFGMLAAVVLALTSLFAAYYHVKHLQPLLDEGERVTGLVVDIHHGARNSKWAVYTFHTREGQSVPALQSRDSHRRSRRLELAGTRNLFIWICIPADSGYIDTEISTGQMKASEL